MVDAEKVGFLKPGFMKSVEDGLIRDIIKRSSTESSDGLVKITSSEALVKAIEKVPKHVFDIAVSDDAKKNLIKLLQDAYSHEYAAKASSSALSSIHKTSALGVIGRVIRNLGFGGGMPAMAKTGATIQAAGSLSSLVRGRTASQIMRRYAGDETAGELFGDQLKSALGAMKTFATGAGKAAYAKAKPEAIQAATSASRTLAPVSATSAVLGGDRSRQDESP
jgi:hypothetical protein